MSEEIPVDAEGSTRNKNYGPQEHLAHLIKVGHKPDSVIIRNFVQLHQLEDVLKSLAKEDER
jgi:hypothetical protein